MDEETSRPLFSLIEKLLPLLEQFLHILEEEKQALATLDASRLIQLANDKSTLLDQILPLSQQLQAHIPPQSTLKAALTEHKRAEAERQLLERFIRTSEAAEKQHLENGTALMRAAQINEEILKILLGREESPTYQEKITGKSTRGAGKPLGKA